MNVRLRYDTDFLGGIYFQDRVQMNAYSMRMELLTQSEDSQYTNVAMDRLKTFIHSVLEHTVFIEQNQRDTAVALRSLGVNVTTLPEQPIDQIVGLMLYFKLNAVMEQHMVITALEISSLLGDSIWYLHEAGDAAGPFAHDGWWHRSTTQHSDFSPEAVSAKVVKVNSTGWSEFGLSWPDHNQSSTSNTVVYGKFPKNEDQ